jgi:hypothetical protein
VKNNTGISAAIIGSGIRGGGASPNSFSRLINLDTAAWRTGSNSSAPALKARCPEFKPKILKKKKKKIKNWV